MRVGDFGIYYHRTNLSSENAKAVIPIRILKITEHKAKCQRVDNGILIWVNKENITVKS